MLDAVTKKKEPEKLSSMVQIGMRLPPPVVEELDEIVERRNAAAGWKEANRSDILREAVEKGLIQIRAEEQAPERKAKRST